MKIILGVLLLLCSDIYAKDDLKFYFEKRYLGEWQVPMYLGPKDPASSALKYKADMITLDEVDRRRVIDSIYPNQLIRLTDFYADFFKPALECPLKKRIEGAPYIFYGHQLIALSLIEEYLRALRLTSRQLSFLKSSCDFKTANLLRQCKAPRGEMKKFLNRALNKIDKTDRSDQFQLSSISDWLKSNGVIAKRYIRECHNNNNCERKSNVESFMNSTCQALKKNFLELCSGEGDYYNLASYFQIGDFFDSSNLSNALLLDKIPLSCPQALRDEFAPREQYHKELDWAFTDSTDLLGKDNKGRLFITGALREFDLKGLDTFLFNAAKIIKQKPPEPAIKAIAIKEKKKKIVDKKSIPSIEKVIKAKEVTLSPIEEAVAQIRKGQALAYPDMEKMSQYYKFEKDKLALLSENLKIFMQKEALIDLKNHDKFGSIKEPVRFLFIWFMITQNKREGIKNFRSIIGDEFYMINDWEKKTIPIKTSLIKDGKKWVLLFSK